MVGGTASTHKYNLKDPRDLDAAFRLVFAGTWTHSATGAKPSGSGTSADTFLIPSTDLTIDNTHIAAYHRTTLSIGASGVHGCANSGFQEFYMYPYTVSLGIISDMYGHGGGDRAYASIGASSKGFMNTSRISSAYSSHNIYFNGNKLSNIGSISSRTGTLPTVKFLMSTGGSLNEVSLFSLGAGLTESEALDYYNIVQAYQTELSRNV